MGNIYADEALWLAGVNPAIRYLSKPRAGRLADAIRTALASGLRHGGTTLRDYAALDGASGRNQHHLRCYGRAGEPCERCGTEAAPPGNRRPGNHLVPRLPAALVLPAMELGAVHHVSDQRR